MVKKWKETKSTLLGLGLGQLLSLLFTITGFTSFELANKGLYAPYSQCLLSYVLLALVHGSIMLYRRQPLKAKFYCYVLLATVDALAKMSVITACQYTSLTSVMLLDCWTIPCVLLLSCLFFNTKYGFQKLVGVAICVVGLVIVAFSDIHSVGRSIVFKPLVADLFIIVGATLYGVSNVCEEIFVKDADRVELMAMLGISGASLTATQMATFERNDFKSVLSSPGAIYPLIGFSFATFLFYSGVPLLLKISGSTKLTLSLLTSNVWAALIQIFVYHEKVEWIYFVAFATVTVGLIVYSGGDEIDGNNGKAASIDEEVGSGQSNNVGISNNDGSKIPFQGARNSFCYISGMINIHGRDVR